MPQLHNPQVHLSGCATCGPSQSGMCGRLIVQLLARICQTSRVACLLDSQAPGCLVASQIACLAVRIAERVPPVASVLGASSVAAASLAVAAWPLEMGRAGAAATSGAPIRKALAVSPLQTWAMASAPTTIVMVCAAMQRHCHGVPPQIVAPCSQILSLQDLVVMTVVIFTKQARASLTISGHGGLLVGLTVIKVLLQLAWSRSTLTWVPPAIRWQSH
mmetsp:Transcript_41209/g.76675  ORF Transcript_41209/g.76675 Transcript_41209/m.76675 type:complete len:218 (-) Transcript_41209:165-818(-)